MPEAKAEFAANLETIRSRTGLPMPVVSAHGDFVNRRLGMANWAILADAASATRWVWRPKPTTST